MVPAHGDDLRGEHHHYYHHNMEVPAHGDDEGRNINKTDLVVYLLVGPVMFQLAVLGTHSPIPRIIRGFQGDRIDQFDGTHGLGGI